MSHLQYRENGNIYRADTCRPLIENWEKGNVSLCGWGRFNYPGNLLPVDAIPGVNSIGFWNARLHQSWGLDWHRNEGVELTFLETGSQPFSTEYGEFSMHPNEMTITRPWQLHKVGNPFIGIGKLHWIIIDVGVRQPHQEWLWPDWIILTKEDLQLLTKMLRQNEQPIWKINHQMKDCFVKLGKLIEADSFADIESLVRIYINEILVQLLQLFRRDNILLDESLIEGTRTIEIFIAYLKDNFAEPWTVRSMSDFCNMGVTRFTFYFRKVTNLTPMAFLNQIRLHAGAEMLLKNRSEDISAVGYQCGFTSPEYFTTVFRKHFGCSPSSYRTGIQLGQSG